MSHAPAFLPQALRGVRRSLGGGGNGARRRSGARESVSGSPRGKDPSDAGTWLERYERDAAYELADRSRAPKEDGRAMADDVRQAVLALRRARCWRRRRFKDSGFRLVIQDYQ